LGPMQPTDLSPVLHLQHPFQDQGGRGSTFPDPYGVTLQEAATTERPGPSITLQEVLDFVTSAEADIPIVVDGGVCPLANHLTIVRCAADGAEMTREGVVHPRAVAAVLGWDATERRSEEVARR
ncbi:hypothetical protein, partial [Actinoplanes sp. DH11]|uniref:hypothetical protein n=1 Tax=Actinoplanes sp. DH11 TaxID=2857011 RepID=UPI001E36ACA2